MPRQPASQPPMWRRLLTVALTLLAVALALPRYATAEPGLAQPAQGPALRPALIVVPADDGQSVLVQAGGVGQLGGQVFTNLRLGPTGNKGSYTMAFSDTLAGYVTSIPGFTAGEIASAGLSITTTGGLDSGELVFTRGLLRQPGDELVTDDGALSLRVINTGTFPADTYVAAAPSFAPPGPPPPGLKLASRAYSLRASGAIVVAEQPLSLRIAYGADTLTPDEVADLGLYVWDPSAGQWLGVAGAVVPSQAYVSAAITRFGFYALMTTTPYQVYMPALTR